MMPVDVDKNAAQEPLMMPTVKCMERGSLIYIIFAAVSGIISCAVNLILIVGC